MGTIEIRLLADLPICGEQKQKGDVLPVPRKLGLDLIGRGEAVAVEQVKREVLRGNLSGRITPGRRRP